MSKLEFNKEKIIDTLKEVIDADQILNINNFSDEILIDLTTNNPTHKAKSDLTKKIIKTLKDNYNSNFNSKTFDRFHFRFTIYINSKWFSSY